MSTLITIPWHFNGFVRRRRRETTMFLQLQVQYYCYLRQRRNNNDTLIWHRFALFFILILLWRLWHTRAPIKNDPKVHYCYARQQRVVTRTVLQLLSTDPRLADYVTHMRLRPKIYVQKFTKNPVLGRANTIYHQPSESLTTVFPDSHCTIFWTPSITILQELHGHDMMRHLMFVTYNWIPNIINVNHL